MILGDISIYNKVSKNINICYKYNNLYCMQQFMFFCNNSFNLLQI